jgi:hypothetical protein
MIVRTVHVAGLCAALSLSSLARAKQRLSGRRRAASLGPDRCGRQSTARTFVVRVRDGAVEQVPVQRGSVTPNLVEVFGALQAGDLVARRGSEELRPGMDVETHSAPSPAPSGSAP